MLIDRRDLLWGCLAVAASLPCYRVVRAWPSSGGGSGETSQSYQGCSSTAAAGRFSAGSLRRDSGVKWIDDNMRIERESLQSAFGVSPGFAYYDDGGRGNAFATPENKGGFGTADGTVGFGLTLLEQMIAMKGYWADAAYLSIVAHEWGHITQFRNRLAMPTPLMELHADILSGWYLGIKVRSGTGLPQGAYVGRQQIFEVGDYEYMSPQHHGTPCQRAFAMQKGGEAGYQGAPLDMAMRGGMQIVPAIFQDAFLKSCPQR